MSEIWRPVKEYELLGKQATWKGKKLPQKICDKISK